MRLKKQKRHRRAVSFFRTCYGFHEPFKVLCDRTFVHHLPVNNITPADTALTNLLGAPVKIFTTRCVLSELECLGNLYAESLKAASNLITTRNECRKAKTVKIHREAEARKGSGHRSPKFWGRNTHKVISRKEMANRSSPWLDPENSKCYVIFGPLRCVQVANTDCFNHVTVIAPQQNPKNSVISVLTVAVKHLISIRHSVASNHFWRRNPNRFSQNRVVLEMGG